MRFCRAIAVIAASLGVSVAACFVSTPVQVSSRRSSIKADELPVNLPVDFLCVRSGMSRSPEHIRLPPLARRYHRRRVRLRGVMFPTAKPTGLSEFFLIPETKRRPVHWRAAYPLHAVIPVSVATGATEDQLDKPFLLEGVLEIDIRSERGEVLFVYRIREARVIRKNVDLEYRVAIGFGC